ncbi:MAG: hypothetical protein IJF37_08030 [Lachnospiraceae bacterium]|nr:hypothetical protein [Lachnospiraceae bacterium]
MSDERIERQINIKELMCSVFAKWRTIIIIVLLAMIATAIINIPSAINYISRLGMAQIAKILIKQMLFIGVAVFVGIVILYIFMYITSDKIKSVLDYELNSNLKLLGAVSKKICKHNNVIDKFIKKCSGVNLCHKDRNGHIERIANVIMAELSVRANLEKSSIALVSVCDKEVVEEFKQLLDTLKIENVSFKMASDVLTSADSVKTIMEADYVLLVECQDKTTYAKLNSSICMMNSWNKDIIGLVLTNVDAL